MDNKIIKLDGMLMIGSAGANVGKTELACSLIRKFCKGESIIGIKVTTIKAKDGQCPRGGQGCGVCSSLDGTFNITEEIKSDTKKDTSRLLAAGASRVFWLRVMKAHLKEALSALIDIIGFDSVTICESNSLRLAVKPGLFIIVQAKGQSAWKSSANEVIEYADRIITSDCGTFDFDLEQIKLIDGKWILKEKAAAIIMAGGGSSRMGTDKSMLLIGERPMIEHICGQLRDSFDQIVISTNDSDKYGYLGFKIVPDTIPGQGPLVGIASGLAASANELNFVIACDIPYVELSFVRKMLAEAVQSKVDIVIPITKDGRHEPLFAVYRKSVLGAMNQVISLGGRKISDVFERCRVKYIELGKAEWLTNINTPTEYEEFKKRCGCQF